MFEERRKLDRRKSDIAIPPNGKADARRSERRISKRRKSERRKLNGTHNFGNLTATYQSPPYNPTSTATQSNEQIKTLKDFCTHIFYGTLIFLVIAAFAVGLDFIISYLVTLGVNSYVTTGTEVAKYFLFYSDLILFLMFIVKSFIKHGKEIWKK